MFEMHLTVEGMQTRSFVYPKLIWVLLHILLFYLILFDGLRGPSAFDYFAIFAAIVYAIYLAYNTYTNIKKEILYLIGVGR
jgi:hypothetical protein